MSEHASKKRRTRTGCLTCRARKVKCDERPGICENCERVVLECRWPEVKDVLGLPKRERNSSVVAKKEEGEGSIYGGDRAASPMRKRGPACSACRIARCRCSQDRPVCNRCAENDIACEYTISSRPYSVEDDLYSPARHEPAVHRKAVLTQPVIDAHLDAYFTYIHPVQANAFLHIPSIRLRVQTGRIDRRLLLAICAVSAQFTNYPPDQSRLDASEWAKEAKTSLILDCDMTLDAIAAALILAKHDINMGQYGSGWILGSVANRTALALGLHREMPADEDISQIERETRRRLFWGCYCLDRMMSTGVSEFVTTRAEIVGIRLPMLDERYLAGLGSSAGMIPPEGHAAIGRTDVGQIGLLGSYVVLMGMRFEIMRYVRHDNSPASLPPWDPLSSFSASTQKLSHYYQTLPAHLHLTPANLHFHRTQNTLSALVMLHVWYDSCLSDLYRIALPGFPESMSFESTTLSNDAWSLHTRAACVAHAHGVARTLRMFLDVAGEDLVFLDTSLPICVFESMRVRVVDLFNRPMEEKGEVERECRADFEMMLGIVDRMKRHFKQAVWLHKEMKRMLRRHGLWDGEDVDSAIGTHGANSPSHHPWQKRVRGMRESDQAMTSSIRTEFVFSNPFTSAPLPTHPPGYNSLEMGEVNDSLVYGQGGQDYGSIGGAPNNNGGGGGGGTVIEKDDPLAWLFGDWMAPGFTAFPAGEGQPGTF